MNRVFDTIGLHVPTVLLPREGVDLQRWSVVACDQYTSQPEYWQQVRDAVDEDPSTLKLILPEVYLQTDEEESIIRSINATMAEYTAAGTLVEHGPGFVLVDRATSHVPSRRGLVVALDLEHYDYNKGAQTLIRATEGTILERLPPRMRVRQDACLELPHIMVLIDDPQRTVIEPLFEKSLTPLYDFDLMMRGGHIRGFLVDREEDVQQVADRLSALADPETFGKRCGVEDQAVMLYAMGDGNHSFATAKAMWEKTKDAATDKQAVMAHPARHALVELVNVHDEGLIFEPIHRALFHVDGDDLLAAAQSFYRAQGETCEIVKHADLALAQQACGTPAFTGAHAVPFVSAAGTGVLAVRHPKHTLVVATLQAFLDTYLESHGEADIDYIHGADVVADLSRKPESLGFILPALDKHDLFKTVILDGALPRKTFSMGEADEKRYYLECRRIIA